MSELLERSNLNCVPCEIDFDNFEEFYLHHCTHVRSPSPSIIKLSASIYVNIVNGGTYNLGQGVARKSSSTISPIKISFKKQGRKKVPFIFKEPKKSTDNNRALEGNKMLDRLGAGVSIQRKGKAAVPAEAIMKETPEPTSTKDQDEKLLEKYSNLISISKKGANTPKETTPEDEKPPAGVLIASKSAKPFDFEEYQRQLKEKKEKEDALATPPRDTRSLLASLKGISMTPKTAVKTEAEASKKTEEKKEEAAASSDESGSEESESEEETKEAKTEGEPKETKVRVSNNLFTVKKEETEIDVRKTEIDVSEAQPTGISIMEKMVSKLSSTPTSTPPPATVTSTSGNKSDDDDIIMEGEVTRGPPAPVVVKTLPPSPTEQLHPDFIAPSSVAPPVMNGQIYTPASSSAPVMTGYPTSAPMMQPGNVTYTTVDTTVPTSQAPAIIDQNAPYWGQQPVQQDLGNVSQTFMQTYLGEPAPITMAPDGGEYMSLEQLGGMTGPTATQPQFPQLTTVGQPMDQLTQQVQRLQPTPPHINVINPPLEVSQNIGPVEPVFDLMHGGVPIQQQPQAQQQMGQQQQPYDPNLMTNMNNMYNNMGNNNPYPFQNFPMQNQPLTPQQQMPPPTTGQFQVPQPPGVRPTGLRPPVINCRSISDMVAPPRPRTAMKRPRLPGPRQSTPPKQPRLGGPLNTQRPRGPMLTPPKKPGEKVANALASRGITMTSNRLPSPQNRSPVRPMPNLNLPPGVSITASSRRNVTVNNNVERPGPCQTVDLTSDDEPSNGRLPCTMCSKIFTNKVALETHKLTHKTSPLPHKCEKCSAAYQTLNQLNQHRQQYHKLPPRQPADMAIPVVDINNAETRAKLLRIGVTQYIPLSQLVSGNNGSFGLPILNIDPNHDKCTSSMTALGAGNVFHLGKLKQTPSNH